MDFEDKVVIVTGASSGIGAAAAVAFSAQGARVVMVGRNEAKLTNVAAKCTNPLVIRADMSKDDDVKRIVDETIKTYGQIDILVNNAGLTHIATVFDNNFMEIYDTIMNTNIRGLAHITSLAAPYLSKTKGNIVNVSSVVSQVPPLVPGWTTYGISKAAVTHFTRCVAAELGPHGVRVNTVTPGPVKTDFLDSAGIPFNWEITSNFTCLNRISDPEEIADVILFLASENAKGITGSDFLTDNGTLVKR